MTTLETSPRTLRRACGLILLLLLLSGCGKPAPSPASPTLANVEIRKGEVVTVRQPFGTYLQYIPTTLAASPQILVLVHGTPIKHGTALDTAHLYVQNWIPAAEEQGVILVAPAFDQENFGSREGPLGGYRGLFGREIEADEFVNHIVDGYHAQLSAGKQFYLYGHSAGGQFVSRYLVRHPERVKGAVISAAATYPSPDPDVSWPYGMGRLQTTVRWPGAASEVQIDVTPDADGWLAAATLPVVVVVGLDDIAVQPDRPGQRGNTRIEIAWHWVNAMNAWAEENGAAGTIGLTTVPGIGHSSTRLAPTCQNELFLQTD